MRMLLLLMTLLAGLLGCSRPDAPPTKPFQPKTVFGIQAGLPPSTHDGGARSVS